MEQERRARKAREARHKLECDRLRRQIGNLQVRRRVGFRILGFGVQGSRFRVQISGCKV